MEIANTSATPEPESTWAVAAEILSLSLCVQLGVDAVDLDDGDPERERRRRLTAGARHP